jgi:hypothetical protein
VRPFDVGGVSTFNVFIAGKETNMLATRCRRPIIEP